HRPQCRRYRSRDRQRRRRSSARASRARIPRVRPRFPLSSAVRPGTLQSAPHWRRPRATRSSLRVHQQRRDARQRRHDEEGARARPCYIGNSSAYNTPMKIHEYQAKALLARHGVPVPRGEVARTVDEAEAAAKSLGGSVVVKAQIHAGGRGKGGGVKIAKNAAEARDIAEKMLGITLVTHQTGPEGRVVQRLLVEETLPIEKELYLGIVLDRPQERTVSRASADGGVKIEEVAAKTPERILKEKIGPRGLTPFQSRKLAYGIGIDGPAANLAAAAMMALARAN